MKWLITGGCGFLGTALIARLLVDGTDGIRVIDNLKVGQVQDLARVAPGYRRLGVGEIGGGAPQGVELVVGDICDADLAVRAAAGCDVIVHFAANTGVGPSVDDPRSDCMTNVIGVFNYLEAARLNGIARFVFASSGATVGEVQPPIHEEIAPHPVSPYGASKLAGEAYCSVYKRTYGIDTVALRFGNVYGPGSVHKSSVVAKFIQRALAGEVLEIYGDGKQTRDFIYIDDLIRAVLRAANVEEVGGEVFQIASSRETTVGEMVERLVSALGNAGVGKIRLDRTEARLGDVRRNFSDTSKARARLGWSPQVELDEGLQRTVAYFVQG